MYKLNRKKKYEIIKEIISDLNPRTINEVVNKVHKDDINDAEYRRRELLEYLDEMNIVWNEHNVDVTDRQHMEVKKPTPEEALASSMLSMEELEEEKEEIMKKYYKK